MTEQDATATATVSDTFSVIENTRSEAFLQHFPNYVEGLYRGEPGGFVLTQRYAETADDYVNFPLKDEDVWVVTFPKCGNQSLNYTNIRSFQKFVEISEVQCFRHSENISEH